MTYATLPDIVLEPIVRNALMEDLGTYGDVTTRAVIPPATTYDAAINAREPGIVSGMQIARIAFGLVDPSLEIEPLVEDGDTIAPGDTLMRIRGKAASILSGERVALNFAGRLSGIATMTASFVAKTEGTKTRITCTRKTTPGLRMMVKHAVTWGGGLNHRLGLDNGVMIKDNHIAVCGSIPPAVERARKKLPVLPKL